VNWSITDKGRPYQSGFGLLEALVALVLISSIGFALLAWIQQNLDAVQRLRGHYHELAARRIILDWSSSLNPMQTPTGETALGEIRLQWSAEQEGDITMQSGYPMGTGLYDIALYKVQVTAYQQQLGTPWFKEQLTRVGYRKARTRRGLMDG